MAGPWEAFAEQPAAAPASAKPWEAFAKEPEGRGLIDQALGLTGERVKTWPERAVRELLTLPKRAIDAAYSAPPGSREATEAMIPVAAETALTMSPVNPAIRAGDKIIPGVAKAFKAEPAVIPTAQELAKAGGSDISAATASDLRIPASAISNYSQKIQADFSKPGSSIHPVDAPNTFAKLKDLEGAPADSFFTPANLQSLRESLQATAQNFNPAAAKDQLAASRAIKALDEFIPSLGAKDTMVGAAPGGLATREQLVSSAMEGQREAERVAGLFERGRGNYAAGMRANSITGELDRANTGILERAEMRAQAANSGRNIDNTIRQKVASALEKPKEISGLSDAELEALNAVVEGGRGRNIARSIGNKLGGGGGLGQTGLAGLGAALGSPFGMAGAAIGATLPTGIGSVSRSIANALAKRDLRSVDELLRKRSPLFKERMANAEMMPVSAESRAAAARFIAQALLAQENQGAR